MKKTPLLISLLTLSGLSQSHDLLTEMYIEVGGEHTLPEYAFATARISLTGNQIQQMFDKAHERHRIIQFISNSDTQNSPIDPITGTRPQPHMPKCPVVTDSRPESQLNQVNRLSDEDDSYIRSCGEGDFGFNSEAGPITKARFAALETCKNRQATYPSNTFESDLFPYFSAPDTFVVLAIDGRPTMSENHHRVYKLDQGIVFSCVYRLLEAY